MLASMKADVPTVGEHPVGDVDVQTASCPWLPAGACAHIADVERRAARKVTTPKSVRLKVNPVVVLTYPPKCCIQNGSLDRRILEFLGRDSKNCAASELAS